MPIQKPCPRCQTPLEIPQPVPEQVQCDNCGAIVKNRTSNSIKPEAVTVTPPAAPVPSVSPAFQTQTPEPKQPAPHSFRPTFAILAGLVGGGLLLCFVPMMVFGVAWIFSSKGKVAEPQPVDIAKEENEKPQPPPPDPRIEIVQPAVDKGVAYLKSKVPDVKGMRAGYVGLNGLTLMECGVPPDDPAILQLAQSVRAAAPSMNQVYDLAAALFFLNRWDESRPLDDNDRKMARSFALRIIAGQVTTGLWGYGGVVLNPEQEAKLLATLQEGTYKPTGAQVVSMSNTQFAMLAVWGARKHGVPVREPLLALAAYFHANQQPDGSWHYPGHSLKATSTCAGLIALAIEVALLEDKEFAPMRIRPDDTRKWADVNKAFEFVAKTIGRKITDPGAPAQYGGRLFNADAGGDLYFLWTLERVGVIYSKDVIGGKDWFDWGYPIVMQAQQKSDGSWNEAAPTLSGGTLTDTCFALLFLKRANIARDLTEIIRTRDGREVGP